MLNSFLTENLRLSYLNEKKISLLTQSNIISNRVAPYISQNGSKYIDNMMNDIVKDLSLEINSRVMIADKNKMIITDSYDTFKGLKINNEEIELALNGEEVARQHLVDKYGKVMYVAVPIFESDEIVGAVFISSLLEDLYDNITETTKKLLTLSLFSLAITGVISFIFADIISKPIENLTEIVNKVIQGKFYHKVKVSGNDELSNLGKAFNMMTTKLEQVDKQRRDFVANVSHELKTPLSSIKILSESLIHQEQVDEKIYKEFLKDIDTEVDRLNRIVNSLLYLVDLDKEKIELKYQITYVNYLIERVIKNLAPIAQKKEINLQFIESEKIQIELDQFKIQQALINIIGNALKYTPDGGEVRVELYSKHDEIVIKVEDNGIGIPKEELPFIFDRFYRVDKARSRKSGGTGLGLAITQQIIGLHQGRIEVESEEDKGTKVYVILPMNTML